MQQYVVKPNDTLYLIAKEFSIPLGQLIRANPQITNPDLIYEGQTIIIPDFLPVPDQIDTLESNAVDIIDDIYMSDWPSADSRVNVIRTTMNNLVPYLQEALIPDNVIFGLNAVIRTLEQNTAQRRTFPAMSQANRITQILADILDYYNVIIPTDVMRLAYFARQMILNVEQNDWAEAYQNYRRMLAVWERIRPELSRNYARDVSDFDQVLNALLGSIDRRDYGSAIGNANRILELNDLISADFEQMYT
jgi:LysM repeat protein